MRHVKDTSSIRFEVDCDGTIKWDATDNTGFWGTFEKIQNLDAILSSSAKNRFESFLAQVRSEGFGFCESIEIQGVKSKARFSLLAVFHNNKHQIFGVQVPEHILKSFEEFMLMMNEQGQLLRDAQKKVHGAQQIKEEKELLLEDYMLINNSLAKMQRDLAKKHELLKQAQDALQKSERRLKEAQIISSTGNFERNLETGKGYWSKELYRLLGYSTDIEPTFEHVFQRVHPEDRDQLLDAMDTIIRTGGEAPLGFCVVHPDQKTLYLHGNVIAKVNSKGAPEFYHGALTDITRIKEAELDLIRLANTDSLTGVNNRRSFFDIAQKELSRSKRHGYTFSMLMLDIDHFKKVNDTFGHDAGDIVLKDVVNLAVQGLRDDDTIGRLGGEEFAVLLPQTQSKEAFLVAERIRQNIEHAIIATAQGKLKVTVSVGVSSITEDYPEIETLLKEADEALYSAKNDGRNQVCVSKASPNG